MRRDELTIGEEYAFIADRFSAPRQGQFPMDLARVRLLSMSEPIMVDRSRGEGEPNWHDTGRKGYKVEFITEWRGGWRGVKNAGDTITFEMDAKGSKKFYLRWEDYAEGRTRVQQQKDEREREVTTLQDAEDAKRERWNALIGELGLGEEFEAEMRRGGIGARQDRSVSYATMLLTVEQAERLVEAARQRAA
jgi:hypothetical protein